MGQLSEPTSQQQIQAGVAELDRSEAAVRQSPSSRHDVASSQVNENRDIAFNPADDAAAPSVAGSSGVSSVGTQTTQQQAAGEWESVMDFARQNGYDVGNHADDRSFLQSVLQAANQRKQEDYYAQLGRQLAPQHQQIKQYLDQQKAPQQPAGPQPWEAPKFDRRWMALVDYDANAGVFIGKPGAPQEIVQAVNNYQTWSEKYGSNPLEAVKPYFEQAFPTMVQEKVQEALGNYRREQTVNQLIQSNAEWMYQYDAHGQPVLGANGRYVPTPNGLRYGQYVNELERSGITNPHVVDQYAKARLMSDIAAQQQRAAGNQAPAAQAQHAMAAGRPQSNVRQSRGPLDAPVNEPLPDQSEMRLEDRLRQNLAAAGFSNDDDFKFGDF